MAERQSWSGRILLRYALFQIPSLMILVLILYGVRPYFGLPAWLMWGIVGLWIAKDAVLFPFVWRAYDRRRRGILNKMVGLRGIAKERLAPTGYIQIRGELWRAEVIGEGPPIEKGEWVQVHEIRQALLRVGPLGQEGGGVPKG